MYNHSNTSISFRYDEPEKKVGIKPPTPPTINDSRIVLLESGSHVQTRKILTPVSTNSFSSSSSSSSSTTLTTPPIDRQDPSSQTSPSPQRVERYTLKEVPTTPTTPTNTATTCYYSAANLSYRSSLASTLSSVSTCSTFSDVGSRRSSYYSPLSPRSSISFGNGSGDDNQLLYRNNSSVHNNNNNNISSTSLPSSSLSSSNTSTPKQYQSWSSTFFMYQTDHFPLSMIQNSLPIGWLRPSLSTASTLDLDKIRNCPHFVLLGFGDTHILKDIFNLKNQPLKDKENTTESTFLWKLDQQHQSVCTLATIPVDGREYSFLENLVLNRIGISSILLCLPVYKNANEIKSILNRINQTLTVLDPQATWWERLVLVFYHGTEEQDIIQRVKLVQDTLPRIFKQLSILPCTLIIPSTLSMSSPPMYYRPSRIKELPIPITQQINRILYQQVCMHQLDHGWWHGSIPLDDDSNSSGSDDDIGQNMVLIIGKKSNSNTGIKQDQQDQQQQQNDYHQYHYQNNNNNYSVSSSSSSASTFSQNYPPTSPTPSSYYSSSSSNFSYYSQTQLKHRFSKHWSDRSNPHSSTSSTYSSAYTHHSLPPVPTAPSGPVSKFPC